MYYQNVIHILLALGNQLVLVYYVRSIEMFCNLRYTLCACILEQINKFNHKKNVNTVFEKIFMLKLFIPVEPIVSELNISFISGQIHSKVLQIKTSCKLLIA